jgi:hypothetical protein
MKRGKRSLVQQRNADKEWEEQVIVKVAAPMLAGRRKWYVKMLMC